MLNPDVTEILDDPEVGGGIAFQVRRVLNKRTKGSVEREVTLLDATGNIQPQELNIQSSTVEDLLTEQIVIRSVFPFTVGENDGDLTPVPVDPSATTQEGEDPPEPQYVATFCGPDEVLWNNKVWRVTRVENWSEWGFTVAYATRVRD